ncbi:MAG: hypothetical protein OES32_14680 [Acidobacteriota bacterium]|nr:hypothetical protein [Acidobacteriota bacterium]MDH3524826.1 hypothetical protein [Acidobacteriota bacterium]
MDSMEQDLLRETRLSTADLTRAAVRRQEMGYRLDTAVLELGLLREAELVPALKAHYALPAATNEELREIPDAVQALLSPEQAAAYRVVPIAEGPGRADLATAGDLDIERADELAFLLGRRVRLFVTNEVRIAQALARHYGQPQPARLLNLSDRLDRGLGPSSDLAGEISRAPATPPPSAVPRSLSAGLAGRARRLTPAKPREVLQTIRLTAEERAAIFGSGPETPPADELPTQVPASALARLSHDLQQAASPTAVGEAFLGYLAGFFARAVLLRPEGELFRGWMARGPEADRADLRDLMTGPGLAAEWRALLADEDAVTTELGPSAQASGFGRHLGLERGGAMTLVPIRVQSRVVCLAIGASARPLERNEKELIGNASLRTGLALQSWILRQKHQLPRRS